MVVENGGEAFSGEDKDCRGFLGVAESLLHSPHPPPSTRPFGRVEAGGVIMSYVFLSVW